jgi:ketosteroid isomerase-like protein
MSQENVEILRRAFAQYARDGVPVFEMFDPDVEVINFDSFPVTRPYRGWDGLGEWLVDLSEPFDNFKFELADVLADDDRQVVTTCRVTGESRTGGPPFELVFGVVWTFRDGKAIRIEGLRTGEEALEAAGLSE